MYGRSKLSGVGASIFTTMSRLAEEHGALNLGQGFPDFDPPEALRQALCRHTNTGKNQYAPMAGVPALREQIALKLERDYHCNLSPESEITVVSGATEGIFAVIAATVSAGDEVIVFDPCYDSYEPAVTLQGGRCIHIPLRSPGFGIDFDRLSEALSSRTRLVVINFPNNPTGAISTRDDLDTLARLLRDTDVLVLSDEVYEHIVFDGRRHASVLGHPELSARSFAVGSFGKAYHSTGWKVGWVAAPETLSTEVRKVHQFLTFSTSTPAQWALADALRDAPQHLQELAPFYESKRDLFRQLLRDTPFELLEVAGTYFQLVDYGQLSSEPDVEFAKRLTVEAKVAVIPVSVFYQVPPHQRLVRLCFAKSDAVLKEAASRLSDYLRSRLH
jgi:methionine transaminase